MCLYVYLDFALWRLKVPSSGSDFLHFRLVLGLSPVWADKCRLTFEAWLNNFLHFVNMWRFSPLHVLDKVEMFHCEIIALLGLIWLFPSMSINMVCSIFSCWCILLGMPFGEHTLEKIQSTNVTLHPHRQAIWGDIWKRTVEKSQTNPTNVTLHPLTVQCFAVYYHIKWSSVG